MTIADRLTALVTDVIGSDLPACVRVRDGSVRHFDVVGSAAATDDRPRKDRGRQHNYC